MKHKIKSTIKNYKSETTKYLSKLNNITPNSQSNLYIIHSLQQIIRFFNDYVIDYNDSSSSSSSNDSDLLDIFNQNAIDAREHLYNLLYFEDSYDIVKEQTENILFYFFPKDSRLYNLLKNKIIINGSYLYNNSYIHYFIKK